MPPPNLLPPSRKHRSARKRRISVAPDRPVKPPKSQHLTNYDKLRIIQLIHSRPLGSPVYEVIPSLRELGYMTIVESTLSRLLKDEAKIRAYVQSNPQRLFEKHPPSLVLPEVDAAVSQWLVQRLSNSRIRITGDMIREKAREFNSMLGYPDNILMFSNGWLERFKIRVGLSRHVFHGEASSAPVEHLEDERRRLLSIIVLFAPWDVYNVDETALLYLLVPTSGLAFGRMAGVKVDKKRLTYMLCANMDGSDKRPPLIIGRAKQPRCFEGQSAESMNFYYFWNSKAWQVHSIWKTFLANLNEDMRRQNRYILLLCDNAPSHKHDPAQYPHVRVEFLAPNLTSHIQPMDGGIIASFKAQYKRRFIRLALDRDNQGIKDIYKINQLQAMYMAEAAWAAVTPQTIANCWRHVGLVPQYHVPPPPAPLPGLNLFRSIHDGYAHPLPTPLLAPPPAYPPPQIQEYYPVIHPEAERAFDQLHLGLVTEDIWTDEEIVTQILRERQDGFTGEDEDENSNLIRQGLNDMIPNIPNSNGESVVIHFTGYSFGGSYSSLCYTQFTVPGALPPMGALGDLYTFGCPRIGYEDLAEALRDNLGPHTGSTWRIINKGDMVAQVPPRTPGTNDSPFNHTDGGYQLGGTNGPESLPSEIGTLTNGPEVWPPNETTLPPHYATTYYEKLCEAM